MEQNNSFLNFGVLEDFANQVGTELAKAPAQIVAGAIATVAIGMLASASKYTYKHLMKTGSPTLRL